MNSFSQKLIKWYQNNKRDLPWRNTNDAYLIWLSEIILQQTRVEQGLAYYLKFASAFPTVQHLAKAENEEVMKLWQGLGYYSRARNLHTTAKIIVSKYKGKFPGNHVDILSLKGIGDYTAAAIASFAYNQPYAVVDGNVYRVLARVYGIDTPIDSSQGKKEFGLLANELISEKHPAIHNQAIMEFGAIQCKPVSPNCEDCPLIAMCFAHQHKSVSSFPVKSKTTKVRNRYFNYIVLNQKRLVVINKRINKDIWTNLYDFPVIETEKEQTEDELFSSSEWKKFFGKNRFNVTSITKANKHILSHQHIYARFIEIECLSPIKKICPNSAILINQEEIQKYAVPRLVELYLINKEKQLST